MHFLVRKLRSFMTTLSECTPRQCTAISTGFQAPHGAHRESSAAAQPLPGSALAPPGTRPRSLRVTSTATAEAPVRVGCGGTRVPTAAPTGPGHPVSLRGGRWSGRPGATAPTPALARSETPGAAALPSPPLHPPLRQQLVAMAALFLILFCGEEPEFSPKGLCH